MNDKCDASKMAVSESRRTIEDFGDQWTRYTDNSGYYGSDSLFDDLVSPLLSPEVVSGKRVADIGSGTGRIVDMLLSAGAEHVTAIEPSRAFEVLSRRFKDSNHVVCHQVTGDRVSQLGTFDAVFSIGVLHHIPEPLPVARSAYRALRPGGFFVAWLYGKEGNTAYLAFVTPLRAFTKKLPDTLLRGTVRLLDFPLSVYIHLCRLLPLPLRDYMRNVIGKMAPDKRRLIIFDQLNPAYAKYYTRDEAYRLFADAGFDEIQLHHRHAYSWTVVAYKR